VTAELGASLPRRDGPAKVTGVARYAADHRADGMLYGVLSARRFRPGGCARSTSRPRAMFPP
jgi:xanthine dehydrogenase YagR molybdenum-binding subunit